MAEREELVIAVATEGVNKAIANLEELSKAQLRIERKLTQSQLKQAKAQGKSTNDYVARLKLIDSASKKYVPVNIQPKQKPKPTLDYLKGKYNKIKQSVDSGSFNVPNITDRLAKLKTETNKLKFDNSVKAFKNNVTKLLNDISSGKIVSIPKVVSTPKIDSNAIETIKTPTKEVSNELTELKKTIKDTTENVSDLSNEIVVINTTNKKYSPRQKKPPVFDTEQARNTIKDKALSDTLPKNAVLINSTKKLIDGNEQLVETYQTIDKGGQVSTFTKIGDAITKVTTKTNKSATSFGKFAQKFKGVFMYRIIRAMIQLMEKAIQKLIQLVTEGVKIFAKFDNATKKAYSTITSSMTIIKGSLGSLFAPVVESIAPVINQIAVAIANFSNSIRQAKAQMQGLTKYTKVNTEYYKEFKDLQNQGAFKFDTFNTLSEAPDESGLYSQANISEDANQLDYLSRAILNFSNTLNDFWEMIQGIAKSFIPLIKPMVDMLLIRVTTIMDVLTNIFNSIKPILDTVFSAIEEIWIELQPFVLFLEELFAKSFEVIGAIIKQLWIMIEPVIIWIRDACKIVANLLSGDIAGAFSSLGDLVMNVFIGIANFVIGLINLVSTLINYAIEGVMKAVGTIVNPIMEFVDATSKFFGGKGVSWRMETDGWKIPMIDKIEYKADGGTVSAGTMFIAGERGTEMVWNNSSGGSSVANIEQIRQAQYESMMQAIYDSGLLVTIENSGSYDIYMDSEKVGNSIGKTQSLRNQLNRTNAGLNLR